MLNMSCKICSVDYGSTLNNLYPRILEKSRRESEKHMLFRLLTELGGHLYLLLDIGRFSYVQFNTEHNIRYNKFSCRILDL